MLHQKGLKFAVPKFYNLTDIQKNYKKLIILTDLTDYMPSVFDDALLKAFLFFKGKLILIDSIKKI